MSISVTTGILKPPLSDPPIATDGEQHSQSWAAFHTQVADQIARLTANVGVTDGSNAVTGQVGEVLTATGGPVTLASGTPANVTTLALPPGDYEVWGNVAFTAAGTTHPTAIAAAVSPTTASLGGVFTAIGATFGIGSFNVLGTGGPLRFNSATAATAYLVAQAVFTVAGMTVGGNIWARRVR